MLFLVFSVSQTKQIIIPPLIFQGVPIPSQTYVKYLGIYFRQKDLLGVPTLKQKQNY